MPFCFKKWYISGEWVIWWELTPVTLFSACPGANEGWGQVAMFDCDSEVMCGSRSQEVICHTNFVTSHDTTPAGWICYTLSRVTCHMASILGVINAASKPALESPSQFSSMLHCLLFKKFNLLVKLSIPYCICIGIYNLMVNSNMALTQNI